MAQTQPLQGTELIDCAKASATQGLEEAAQNCGYGEDTERFQNSLRQACDRIGIHINELGDLITPQQKVRQGRGIEIAPDSKDSL